MPAACADAILPLGRQGLDAVGDLGRPVPLAARVRRLAREGEAAPFPHRRCAVPLPDNLPTQPHPDDGRPDWLRGAPQVALDVWQAVRHLEPGAWVTQADLIDAVPDCADDFGRLRIEAQSTLEALSIGRVYGPIVDGRSEVRWRRAPWRAPVPCRRCGVVR